MVFSQIEEVKSCSLPGIEFGSRLVPQALFVSLLSSSVKLLSNSIVINWANVGLDAVVAFVCWCPKWILAIITSKLSSWRQMPPWCILYSIRFGLKELVILPFDVSFHSFWMVLGASRRWVIEKVTSFALLFVGGGRLANSVIDGWTNWK